mmetsp:Transcript_27824/g.85368  ORF Transcript_27824/g.85368 Transcript_27824/m.85368 type:complete len:200 (+) Transcript_27824:61-660(+)
MDGDMGKGQSSCCAMAQVAARRRTCFGVRRRRRRRRRRGQEDLLLQACGGCCGVVVLSRLPALEVLSVVPGGDRFELGDVGVGEFLAEAVLELLAGAAEEVGVRELFLALAFGNLAEGPNTQVRAAGGQQLVRLEHGVAVVDVLDELRSDGHGLGVEGVLRLLGVLHELQGVVQAVAFAVHVRLLLLLLLEDRVVQRRL